MLDNEIKEKSLSTIVGGEKKEIWTVEPSESAKNCRNYIREIVDDLDLQPNPEKPVIALSIGDPTVYGNLPQSETVTRAVADVLAEGRSNGYAPSVGHESARSAVASYLSRDGVRVAPTDVVLCSGCSSALELCITALACPTKRHSILIPRPGFPIYRTLAESIGVAVAHYNLQPENGWRADLRHLEAQIDARTAAIVVNNPSNPCGSVYSRQHLAEILEIARVHRVPVIADEIYERLVFEGRRFVSTAALGSGVPVLVCGGLAKRFLVPGWRLGWVAVHDEVGAFRAVRRALAGLSQRTVGCNTLVQGALPAILGGTPESYHEGLVATLEKHARLAYDALSGAKGLCPHMPDGTMYMIVEIEMHRFPMFGNGLDLVRKLMEEESVFCLPGECFQIPGFMRIVLTVPEELLLEACQRIAEFCNRYYTQ